MPASDRVYQTVGAVMLYERANGRPPTIRELGRILGLKSSHSALMRVRQAVALGLLESFGARAEARRYRTARTEPCPACGRR